MTQKTPISSPTSYVAPTASGFADSDGTLLLVSAAEPLPVTLSRSSDPVTPLEGSTAASLVVGPFAPAPDLPLHLELQGNWTGTVTLQRSIDNGATRTGLTAGGMAWARFTANANEPVWQESEAGATFYLDIVLGSGTLGYRISQ